MVKFRATRPVSAQKKTGRMRIRQKLKDIGVLLEAQKSRYVFRPFDVESQVVEYTMQQNCLVTIPHNELFYAIFCKVRN